MKIFLLSISLFFSAQFAFASFPKNSLHLLDVKSQTNNVTESDFNRAIEFVVGIWKPVAKLHGAELIGVPRWDYPEVNSLANREGNRWFVNIYGGLARRPEITLDGLVMVICHEIGHHLGGYYFNEGDPWAAAQGEADYWASHVCAKKAFSKAVDRNSRFRAIVPLNVKSRCDKQYTQPNDQNICYRTAAGGLSLAYLLTTIEKTRLPRFETPDPTVVARTSAGEPSPQCRLDTYFAGALCNVPFKVDVIPGIGVPQGNNSKEAELIAMRNSCSALRGQTEGIRPACWFKPQVTRAELRLK